MKEFIKVRLGKDFKDEDLKRVLHKLDSTEARIMKEPIPYLRDDEYNRLVTHKKQKKKRTR